MSEVEKRGRGRPKGSLNLKTIAKQQAMQEATTLDVSFETELAPLELDDIKVEEEAVSVVEDEEPESEPEPEPEPAKPKPKRKTRKPASRDLRSQVPEAVPEEVTPPPSPVKEVKKRKPRAATVPRVPEPPLTYLQVLQRGLAAANATQKAERVQRYDAYFSHL